METKTCPHCRKQRKCKVVNDNNALFWVWECSEGHHFERPTYFRYAIAPLLFFIGGGL